MYQIRPATAQDQETIQDIVHAAGINPMALHWQHFLIAEDAGAVIGIGQIKTHNDGSRELASIAVIPERRGQGIASAMIRALLAQESGALFLTCRAQLESFYTPFGFRAVDHNEMTPYFRRLSRLGNVFARLAGTRMLVMKRNADQRRTTEDE